MGAVEIGIMNPNDAPIVAPSTAATGEVWVALARPIASGAIKVAVAVLLVASDSTIATPMHSATTAHVDDAPVHALADWFFAQGFACEDPQDAGFDRPRIKPPAIRADLDDLIGGQWLGMRFDRNYATALDLDFTLADGRHALLRMLHLGRCQVPELSPLVKSVVTGSVYEPGDYDSLSVQFEGGHALVFTDAVFGGVHITA